MISQVSYKKHFILNVPERSYIFQLKPNILPFNYQTNLGIAHYVSGSMSKMEMEACKQMRVSRTMDHMSSRQRRHGICMKMTMSP
ncbi:hypothetical protein RHGRI_017714 [Rhododendron griersonianum]|uniref:Uncharacterized protein n=1 Tax=Rhododendron griersonianum TaxID=479676 RepID=A0AAV6JYZ0_9ERIC|nr:hypothetical protein RHGRI_017714 [Rhododendron griersonianum]